jgi:hypothetical protein
MDADERDRINRISRINRITFQQRNPVNPDNPVNPVLSPFALSRIRLAFSAERGDNAMTQDNGTIALTAAVEETIPAVAQSVFCRELRSKRYYFLEQMPTEEDHILDGSNRCWCRLTMQVIGPDGDMTHPTDCRPGRSCYRSLFE